MNGPAQLRSIALAVACVSIVALADADADTTRAVDVQDLPPLPAMAEESSNAASVLAASAAEEDVVVGAAKREQSLGNVASAVTVISADRIRRFGYRTIGEAVAGVAGAYLVDNRLSYSIGIRGLQVPGDFNTRILVLVDGATVNEAWGAFAGLGFDALVGIDEIARIEVIRGPVSSVYGTNAFFGIINIVTRGAAESPRAWARTAIHSINGIVTSAGFAVGSVNKQVRGSIQVNDRFGEPSSAIQLPDGGDINANADHSTSFVGGVVGVYGGSFAQVRALHWDRESPFAPYDVLPQSKPYSQVNRWLLVEGGHARDLTDRLTVAGRVYANIYRFSDDSPPPDPITDSPLDSTGSANTYGAEVRGRYEVLPHELGVTAGTEASYNKTRSTAYTTDAPNTLVANVPLTFNLEALYSEVDAQPLPWLGITGGVRADRHSRLENKISPRVALFAQASSRYGAKLLYAQGFRNASAYEGYFEDGSQFVAHPENLRAETIRSLEAVLWAKPIAGLSTRLSVFSWDARNIIEQAPAPEDPSLLQFQNTTRYVSQGVEVEASYRNADGWYAFGGGTAGRIGSADSSGAVAYGRVVNAPAITFAAGVSSPRIHDLVHVSTDVSLIGSRATRVDANGNPSPDSPAWLGWNITLYAPHVRGFDVTASVRNVLGTRDLMPAPGDYDRSVLETRVVPRVPGEGREVFLKVGYAY